MAVDVLPDFRELNIRTLSDLDKLPWFEKNAEGQPLVKASAGIPPVIDTHSHVGWSYGFAPAIDMFERIDLLHDNAARLMGLEAL